MAQCKACGEFFGFGDLKNGICYRCREKDLSPVDSFSEPVISDESFFGFEKMWTLPIVKIIYVLGVLTLAVLAIQALSVKEYGLGFLLFVFGNLFLRLSCEWTVLFFKIHEKHKQTLIIQQEILETLKKSDSTTL